MTRSSVQNYQGIGAPLRRVEDKRFLTGHGRFVADIELSGALACALVRSPHAHAAIRRIDASAALAAPGVVAVLTGADMAADGVAPMRPLWLVRSRDGSPMAEPARFAFARETVRHVGEPVAAVVAATLAQAVDAAERLAVDYAPLPAVTDACAAQAEAAPQLHACARDNVCFRWARVGDGGERRVVDLEALGRVEGLRKGCGDDGRHRLADVAHRFACEREPRRLGHGRALARTDHPKRPHRCHAVLRHIGAGQHRDDARRCERGRCVDPANGRVRVRGANERAGERAGELDVGHEAPAPGEKALILDAPQRRADALIIPHARTRHVVS